MDGFNEYGGCLWLEAGVGKKDYYSQFDDHRIEVDCGRSALQYIIETYSYKRIWLPVYNCPLVHERIKRVSDMEICFYNLREDFSPEIGGEAFQKGDVFLWVNYFGVMSGSLIDYVDKMQDSFQTDVIIDNIPAFFSEPRMKVFNIYSCRKFMGVPDGGYLIKHGLEKKYLPTYNTSENYLYLLKAIEQGSNKAYGDYKDREEKITKESSPFGMPMLTKRILEGIDYEGIKEKRLQNFLALHNILGKTNRMKPHAENKTPSVYPYLTDDSGLRQRLLNRDIYVSRFWNHVLTNGLSNTFEKDLAEYLIPLPIDQRYGAEDMEKLAAIVMEEEVR